MKNSFLQGIFKKINFDFTFFKKSLVVLVPLILSALIDVLVSFVDSLMVNNFSRNGQPQKVDFAGVGIGNEIWLGFSGIYIAVSLVFSVIYSQFVKNKKIFVETSRLNFWVFLVLGSLGSLIMFFAANFLVNLFFISNPGENAQYVKPIASDYVRILSLGSIFFFCSVLILNPLNIKGKTNYALYLSLVSLALNFVLNWVFIYFLKLGGQGSAWATTISYFVQMILSLYFVLKHRDYFIGFWKIFDLNILVFKEVLKRWWLFTSFSLMQISFSFSTIIWVNLYSSDYINSLIVGYIVGGILFTIFESTNQGVKIFIGPLLGDSKFEKAKVRSIQLLYTNLFLGFIFLILAISSATFFPNLMLNDSEQIRLARIIILVYAFGYFGILLTSYFSAIFETSGFQLVVNIFNYFFQIWFVTPLMIILSSVVLGNHGLSFEWNFFVSILVSYIPSTVFVILYRRYKWLRKIDL